MTTDKTFSQVVEAARAATADDLTVGVTGLTAAEIEQYHATRRLKAGVVRMDVAVLILHLFALRFCAYTLPSIYRSKVRGLKKSLAANTIGRLGPIAVKSSAKVFEMLSMLADVSGANTLIQDFRDQIDKGLLATFDLVEDLKCGGKKPPRPRRRQPVFTRHFSPKQRRPNK